MAFSNVSFSNASDSVRDKIRKEIFTASTNTMDIYSRRDHYTVYEYRTDGHVLTNHFMSSDNAYDFANQFCNPSSKVYIYMTSCEDVFEPHILNDSSEVIYSNGVETSASNGLVNYDSEDDSDFDPDNCSGSDTSDEELTDEELTDEEDSDVDLSDMFFSVYGKGLLLIPTSNNEFFGQKYFLDGWWMPNKNGWFFKSEFEDTLLELGAIKATSKASKASKTSKTSKASTSETLSGMTFTRYGKGYILTTDDTDSRFGTKYLLSNVTDGGFWNSNANGWFFRKTHFDLLRDLGAQYIKSESNYETSDTVLDIKPNMKRYGKGYFLKADTNFKYTGEDMKYFENGWYIPTKKGWFFKASDAKSFMKKYNM
jgi:hypothetical protein